MLGSLRGTIIGRIGQRILVEVGGVGYWVFTGSWQPDGEVTCYLHHHVREEASDLYGFPDLNTLELFEMLLTISGVGPKAALAVLSLGTPGRIRQAVEAQDAGFLSHAPGIGSKAAQKIILELQEKIRLVAADSGTAAPQTDSYQDIVATLEGLGYKEAQIRPLIEKLPADVASLNSQIRWILQQL